MQGNFLINTKSYGREHNPYGSALLVSDKNDGYFEIVIPLEGIPSIFGEYETFDFNILTEVAKGLVEGKLELQSVTQEFLLTKENLYRLDQLKGQTYKYMVACGNGVGYTFNAKVSYKIADIDNGSILQGELTITPSTFDTILSDVRPFIRPTLMFAGTIPENITLTNEESTQTIDLVVEGGTTTETVKVEVVGDASAKYTASWADGKLTVNTASGITYPSYAELYLTASSTAKMETDSTADKYAPYTLIINLDYEVVA